MKTFLEPQNALQSDWLWVVQSGPNRGQALPVLPGVFGRFSGFDDSSISRENLNILRSGKTLHAVIMPGKSPVYNLWKTLGLRWRIRRKTRLKPGRKLKIGKTQLLICRRPTDLRLAPPPAPRPGSQRWLWFMLLPLMFTLGLGAFIGWRILFIFTVLGIILATWLIWRAMKVPRPEKLWLAAATPLRKKEKPPTSLRIYTGNRFQRRVLEIPAGENLCLTGPGAQGFAYWLIAQALIFSQGYLSPHNASLWKGAKAPGNETKLEIRVIAPHEDPNCSEKQIAITIATTPPPWAQRSLWVKAKQGRLGAAWFTSLKSAWEHNPSLLELNPPPPGDSLPRLVTREVLGATDTDTITASWEAQKSGLSTPLGIKEGDTTWELDLVEEGPHALVAGTTGSGKSELLTSWLLGLALHYSPTELRYVLIDYKGGAAFGELAQLPHVHGVLTDLQPTLTGRALQSLEAFLRKREITLAAVKARDITHYYALTGKRLARVMIVVDEFRALATDHSEAMENLIRLATHGRSLGLHLVLATQKPGGIVNGQILANTNLRIALRMRSSMDSNEVLGDSRAANLPTVPGRLYWEGSSEGLAQAAWCGADSGVKEIVEAITNTWKTYSQRHATDTESEYGAANAPLADSPAQPNNGLPEIWLPEMPVKLESSAGFFALTDWPRLATQQWRSPQGIFGIFGNPGTGRSTALLTLATNELVSNDSARIIVVSPTKQQFAFLAKHFPQNTVVFSPDELWRLEKMCILLESGKLQDSLVLLDGADMIAESLERISPGGTKRLENLLSGSGGGGYRLAFTAALSTGRSSWGTLAAERFVLEPRDTVDLHTAGIEGFGTRVSLSSVIPSQMSPGRGVWQYNGTCVEAQIGLPNLRACESNVSPVRNRSNKGADFSHFTKQLAALPGNMSYREIPSSEELITLGWASERNDWARFTPRRWWCVENTDSTRGLLSQLKREYRRLGYKIQELENLDLEHNHENILLVISNFEQEVPKLKKLWELRENQLNFDITILEILSPASLHRPLTRPGNYFANLKTNILASDNSLETRHRIASTFQITPEIVRKLQVTTNYPVIFQDEDGISAMQFPIGSVKHLT